MGKWKGYYVLIGAKIHIQNIIKDVLSMEGAGRNVQVVEVVDFPDVVRCS